MSFPAGAWLVDPKTNIPGEVDDILSKLFSGIDGAGYEALLYVGSQVVHGTNYMVICKKTVSAPNGPLVSVVKLIVNQNETGVHIVSVKELA